MDVNSLECLSMNNQKCKTKSEIINVNSNEAMFYPYSIKKNKCKVQCSCNNDPYALLVKGPFWRTFCGYHRKIKKSFLEHAISTCFVFAY